MMLGSKTWPAAALAAGLVALAACGQEPSTASKEAQAPGGEEHSHAHGGHHDHGAPPQQPATGGEHQHHTGHGAAAPAADHSAMDHGAGAHAGHAPQRGANAAHEGHAGHGATPAQAPADPSGHAGHAGHSAPAGETPARLRPEVPDLPEQPESILRPDPLDAPAATSVLDAQRAAEMSGGHAGHGAGSYRHVDAGRGPEAQEGSEHHDHGAAVYACPMHPEVTSKTPGTCPKCGMKLVERREE